MFGQTSLMRKPTWSIGETMIRTVGTWVDERRQSRSSQWKIMKRGTRTSLSRVVIIIARLDSTMLQKARENGKVRRDRQVLPEAAKPSTTICGHEHVDGLDTLG